MIFWSYSFLALLISVYSLSNSSNNSLLFSSFNLISSRSRYCSYLFLMSYWFFFQSCSSSNCFKLSWILYLSCSLILFYYYFKLTKLEYSVTVLFDLALSVAVDILQQPDSGFLCLEPLLVLFSLPSQPLLLDQLLELFLLV